MLDAQVGINTDSPSILTNLDIKNMVVAGDTIPKGMLIPRLTSKQRDAIDVSATDANSLFIYNIDEDCYNYYAKSSNKWLNLCGKYGLAKLSPITCNDIEIVGTYIKGVETNRSNYMNVTVNVLKPGVFTVSGFTSNGYYFSSQQTALSTGSFSFKVYASGTPIETQIDDITMSGQGFLTSDLICAARINVLEPVGEYTLNCANIVVNGTYLKGTALSDSEYIEVSVNVAKKGSYAISTTRKNGIIFSSTGVFSSAGPQTVKLMGSGTPTVNFNFDVTLVTNSKSGLVQCSTTIPVLLPTMTFAVIGTTTGNNSWNSSPRKEVLTNTLNFSRTGTIKINGLNQLWATDTSSDAITYLNSGYNGAYPDVVLFYSPGVTQNAALATALANYTQKGGFVIYGTTDGDVANTNLILSAMFGSSITAKTQIAGTVTSNDVYGINQNPLDPVINGTFSTLSNYGYWGENGTSINSVIVPTLPTNSVQLVSAFNSNGKQTVDPAYSIVWYNPKGHFVYFGSSVGASVKDDGVTTNPAYYLNNVPQSKFYGRTTSQFVSNSFLELNALSWCLHQAAINGINAY